MRFSNFSLSYLCSDVARILSLRVGGGQKSEFSLKAKDGPCDCNANTEKARGLGDKPRENLFEHVL